jgi:hypothetical protein
MIEAISSVLQGIGGRWRAVAKATMAVTLSANTPRQAIDFRYYNMFRLRLSPIGFPYFLAAASGRRRTVATISPPRQQIARRRASARE